MASKIHGPGWEGSLRSNGNGKKKEKQNIAVYVRCRPFSEEEKRNGISKIVQCNQNDVEMKERATGSSGQHLTKKFNFDRVFAPSSDQIEVYQEVVAPVVKEALMGYNCTIFAYGQTGTGKTFTMEGERSEEKYTWDADPLSGIIPRCVHQIFDTLESAGTEFAVRVSYLELYNEELFDLLSNSDNIETGMKLKLFEDTNKALVIQNLSENSVRTKHEVYKILAKGSAKRKTAETQMNAHSSRSHSIFIITIHMKEYNVNGEEELIKTAKLNLVDLAGSENIGRSGAKGVRATEAGNINQSLLTLGRVITALVDRTPHVPYRESKLTRLLQDSLGGRTKTSIIATISPGSNNMEETLSTLDYAHRAKSITNKPEVNQKLTKKALIKQYEDEIEQLKRDLSATREKNGFFIDQENYDRMKNQLELNEEIVKQLEETIEDKEQSKAKYEALFISSSAKLENTTQKLENTRTALGEVHDKLKTNRRERDAKAEIVTEQRNTEDRLVSDLTHVIDVADEEKENLDGIHDKLDRQRKVDVKNEEILSSHATKFSNEVEAIRQNCSDYTKALSETCASHVMTVREMTERQVNDLENSKAILDSLSDRLVNCLSKDGKDENNVTTSLKEASTLSEDGFKSMENYLGSALVKYILNSVAEVGKNLTVQQQQIQTCLERTTASSESQLQRISQFEESHFSKLQDLNTLISAHHEERETAQKSVHSELDKVKQEVIDSFTKSMERIMSNQATDRSRTDVLTTKVRDEAQLFQKEMIEHKNSVESSKEQIRSDLESVESSRLLTENTIKQLPEDVDTLKSEYAIKAKRRCKDVTKTITSTINIVDDVNAQAQEVLKARCDEAAQKVDEQNAWSASMVSYWEEQRDQSRSAIAGVESQLSNLVREEATFVTEEILKNEPTGRTPKRKNFRYKGHDSILRTRDHNVIVEEFEGKYELSDSIINAHDICFDDSFTSDAASTATADSGRPGSRDQSRDRAPDGAPLVGK